MATQAYKVMMEPLSYRLLFKNLGKRQMVPSGKMFLWSLYMQVRDEMSGNANNNLPATVVKDDSVRGANVRKRQMMT